MPMVKEVKINKIWGYKRKLAKGGFSSDSSSLFNFSEWILFANQTDIYKNNPKVIKGKEYPPIL